jgi:hypothetical protein
MIVAVTGQALLPVPAAISTFATPAIGQAYLAGSPTSFADRLSSAMTATFLLGLLLALVGNVLLGVALWRSALQPRWVGAHRADCAMVVIRPKRVGRRGFPDVRTAMPADM